MMGGCWEAVWGRAANERRGRGREEEEEGGRGRKGGGREEEGGRGRKRGEGRRGEIRERTWGGERRKCVREGVTENGKVYGLDATYRRLIHVSSDYDEGQRHPLERLSKRHGCPQTPQTGMALKA